MKIRLTPKDVLETCAFAKEQATFFLRGHLPAYMIPIVWFVIYQVPLSTSGHIDRNALDQWILTLPFEAEWDTVKRSSTDLYYIPQNSHVAHELSELVSDMVSRDSIVAKVLIQGKDFLVNDAGIDSIQTIKLLSWIRKRYRVRIAVERLTHPQTTIMSLAKEVQGASNPGSELQVKSNTDLSHEVTILSRTFMRTNIHLYKERQSQKKTTEAVLLTGSTGYLGKQILKQLLMDTKIENVIVHVRANDDQVNLAKVCSSTGYAQSKLVSELLVKRFGSSTSSNGRQIIIIKPGYIIGTPEEGVANLTD
jgi:acyl carrier protein